jgi:hypothetical protein
MTNATKTPINSIVIPAHFVRACIGWEGKTTGTLYAVTSTGNLTTGTIAPAGCEGDEEKWYLQIWRNLSFDLGGIVSLINASWTGDSGDDDVEALTEFETWVDEVIIPRLEEEYGLADWDACDG